MSTKLIADGKSVENCILLVYASFKTQQKPCKEKVCRYLYDLRSRGGTCTFKMPSNMNNMFRVSPLCNTGGQILWFVVGDNCETSTTETSSSKHKGVSS